MRGWQLSSHVKNMESKNTYTAWRHAWCYCSVVLFPLNVGLASVEPCTLGVESKTSILHNDYTHRLYRLLLFAVKCGAGNGRAVCAHG